MKIYVPSGNPAIPTCMYPMEGEVPVLVIWPSQRKIGPPNFYRDIEAPLHRPMTEYPDIYTGLPDFTWLDIPKWGKIYHFAPDNSNSRKLQYKLAIWPNGHIIYQPFPI
jgi:hypothetical protein